MTEEPGSIRRSRFFRTATATLCASAFVLGGVSTVVAQDATPQADVDVDLVSIDGETVGSANLTEVEDAVTISVTVDDLEPGTHGLHIHETGECDPSADEPFSTAGGHFNPTGASHGAGPATEGAPAAATPAGTEAHAGDLGNIMVGDNGTATMVITTDRVSLNGDGENSLTDQDGSALVVHEGEDDLMTDPSGESGPRIACGVISPAVEGTPAAVDEGESAEGYQPGDDPVEAQDALVFSPSVMTASPGDTIEVVNVGSLEHDFVVDALGIDQDLPNGELMEIQIPEDAEPGEYEFYCSVPGHKPAGMIGTLIIE